LHGLLHAIAAGAATPVLIVEVVDIALEIGLSVDEAYQAIADAQKKYDRAMLDAERLDKKIQSDLDALEKCRAAMRGPKGVRSRGLPVYAALLLVAQKESLDTARMRMRMRLVEDARIIAMSRDYGNVTGTAQTPYYRQATKAFRNATVALRSARARLPKRSDASTSDAAARMRATAAAGDPTQDLTREERAGAQAVRAGPLLLKAFDGLRSAHALIKSQTEHDERVLQMLRARSQ